MKKLKSIAFVAAFMSFTSVASAQTAPAAAQSCPKDSGVRLAKKLLGLFDLKFEFHSRFPRKENPRGGALVVERNSKRSYNPYTVEAPGFLSFEDIQGESCISFDRTWKKLVLETLLTRGGATGAPDSLKCPKDEKGRPDCGRLADGLYYSPILNIDGLVDPRPFTAYFLGDNPEATLKKITNCVKLDKAKNECRKTVYFPRDRDKNHEARENCIDRAIRGAEARREPCEERDSPDVIAGGLYNGKGTFFGSACAKGEGWVQGANWQSQELGYADPIGTPVPPVEQLRTTGAAVPGGGGKRDTELKEWLVANKALIKGVETTSIIPKLLDGATLTKQECGRSHFNSIEVAERLSRARDPQQGLPAGCELCIDFQRSPLICNGQRDDRKAEELRKRHLQNPLFKGGWEQKIQCQNLDAAYNDQTMIGLGQNRFKVADRLNQMRRGMRGFAASHGCTWAPPGVYPSEHRIVCGTRRNEAAERTYVSGQHVFRNTAAAALTFLRERTNLALACRCPESKRVNFRLWDNRSGKSAVCFHAGILMAGFRSGSLSELNTYKDVGLAGLGLLTGGLALIPCLFSDACDDIRPTGEVAFGVDGAIEVKPEVSEDDLRAGSAASLYDSSRDAQPSADPFTPGTRLHLGDACLPYAAKPNLPLRLVCEESMASGCINVALDKYDPTTLADSGREQKAACCHAKVDENGVGALDAACCMAYVTGTLKKGDVIPKLANGRRQCDDELRALMILSQEVPFDPNSAPVPFFNLSIRAAREFGYVPILTASTKEPTDPLRFDLLNIAKPIAVDFSSGHDRVIRDQVRAACRKPVTVTDYDAAGGDAAKLNPSGYAQLCGRTIWAAVYRGEAPRCALTTCSRRADFESANYFLPPKPIPRTMVVLENMRRRGRFLDGRAFQVTPANDPKFFSLKLGVRTVGAPFKLSLNIRAADKGRLHNRVAWSPPVEVQFNASFDGSATPYAFSTGSDGNFATIGGEVATDARIKLVGGDATARAICDAIFKHVSLTTLPGVIVKGLLVPVRLACPGLLAGLANNPLDTILTRVVPRIVQGVHRGLMLGVNERSIDDLAKRAVNLLFDTVRELKGKNNDLTKLLDVKEWSKCWNAFLKNRRTDCKE